jgi:excisionase family DNA binding protein
MSDLPVLTTAGPDDPRAWVRIARAVLAGIHAGKLQPGDRLPGITTMAAQFGVSTKSVSRAGRELTTAGILTRNPGGPLRVPLGARARAGPGDAAPQVPDKTPPPAAAVRPLMTVAECAGQARLMPTTIYRMMDTGTIESTRIGRARRIYADSWTAYLTSGRTRPAQP